MRDRFPWGDWALLLVSLLLAFGGSLGLLHPRGPNDRVIGLTCVVGFGLAALVFAGNLWRRHKDKDYRGIGPVTLAPGARLIIQKGRILLLGVVLTGFGTLGAYAALLDEEPLVAGCAGLFGLGGLTLLLLYGTGRGGSEYLAFEKGGLRVGNSKGSFLMAWDNIAQVVAGDHQSNAVVWVWLKDPEAAAATGKGEGKHWSPGTVFKGFKTNQLLQKSDWMVMTWQYGVDAPVLAKALATYATDPAVRAGLEERLRLPGKNT